LTPAADANLCRHAVSSPRTTPWQGWRGRPLPDNRPSVETDAGQRLKQDTPAATFEDIAFIDRRDDEVGVIDETKLLPAHLPPPRRAGAVIFRKDLRTGGDSRSRQPVATRR
jgi:hypothetical protein